MSKILVVGIVALNVLFTVTVLAIFVKTGAEPTTLIIAWFAFTSGELGLLALIKIKKGGREDGAKEVVHIEDIVD